MKSKLACAFLYPIEFRIRRYRKARAENSKASFTQDAFEFSARRTTLKFDKSKARAGFEVVDELKIQRRLLHECLLAIKKKNEFGRLNLGILKKFRVHLAIELFFSQSFKIWGASCIRVYLVFERIWYIEIRFQDIFESSLVIFFHFTSVFSILLTNTHSQLWTQHSNKYKIWYWFVILRGSLHNFYIALFSKVLLRKGVGQRKKFYGKFGFGILRDSISTYITPLNWKKFSSYQFLFFATKKEQKSWLVWIWHPKSKTNYTWNVLMIDENQFFDPKKLNRMIDFLINEKSIWLW